MLLVAAVVVALLAFPARYRCVGDDLTFTTSEAFAEQTCTKGDSPPGVERDPRIAPRLAVIAGAIILSTILLRFASSESEGAVGDHGAVE
jgi:hypothetical protein